jgi:hypothetical protein
MIVFDGQSVCLRDSTQHGASQLSDTNKSKWMCGFFDSDLLAVHVVSLIESHCWSILSCLGLDHDHDRAFSSSFSEY